jgi:hypothetical protein
MPEGADAATELSHEHAVLERMVTRIAGLTPCPERTDLVRETGERFLTHARVEQSFLCPALRGSLPKGVDDAAEEGERQRDAEQLIEELRSTDEDDSEYATLANRLVLDIQQHIERQETVLLPTLVDTCPQEELNRLGRQLRSGLEDSRSGNAPPPGAHDYGETASGETGPPTTGLAEPDPMSAGCATEGSRVRRTECALG